MVVTDNQAWAKKAKYLTTQAKDDPLEFVHGEIGYNYRMNNIQAALGCAQLEVLDDYIAAKRRIASIYYRELGNVPGITPAPQAPWAFCVYWMYTALIDAKRYGMDSRTLLGKLEEERIQTRPLWQPNHLSPAHVTSKAWLCPVAEMLNRRALSLPCSVGLDDSSLLRVIELIKALGAA